MCQHKKAHTHRTRKPQAPALPPFSPHPAHPSGDSTPPALHSIRFCTNASRICQCLLRPLRQELALPVELGAMLFEFALDGLMLLPDYALELGFPLKEWGHLLTELGQLALEIIPFSQNAEEHLLLR